MLCARGVGRHGAECLEQSGFTVKGSDMLQHRWWAAVFGSALLLAFLATGVWSTRNASAAISDAQKKQVTEINGQLDEAAKLAVAKKNDEAVAIVTKIQPLILELAAVKDTSVQKAVEPLMGRLKLIRRTLERNGAKLPELPDPAAKPAGNTPAPAAGGVSFTKQIAPLVVGKCRNCHVTGQRGMFSMASYDSLMRGANNVTVLSPGKGKESRIVEILESGDMPRGGGRLSNEEIGLITKWIDEGAKFDGTDRTARIDAGVPQPQRTDLTVTKATGNETVKFSRDIAPVIASTCTGCHGGQNPRGNLSMETFAQLLRGSQDNVIISPGKPADSILIKRIKGIGGDRMPMGRAPLSDETIAKFEKWIAEGAKFDGRSATMELSMVAAIYEASQMTHEQLAAKRIPLADGNWHKGIPDEKADKVETDNFLVMGNVGDDRLKEIGQVAEAQLPKVAAIFAESDKPFIKGRLTIFAFNKRPDYSEYGQMVERRELPRTWRGHWRFNVIDAYACILPPQSATDGGLDSLVAEQIAGTYIESHGAVPAWFGQGSAWVVASRLGVKDPRVLKWNESLSGAVRSMASPDDFMTGKMGADDASIVSYGFCKFLMENRAAYKKVLTDVEKGMDFDAALSNSYRAPNVKSLAAVWATAAARKK